LMGNGQITYSYYTRLRGVCGETVEFVEFCLGPVCVGYLCPLGKKKIYSSLSTGYKPSTWLRNKLPPGWKVEPRSMSSEPVARDRQWHSKTTTQSNSGRNYNASVFMNFSNAQSLKRKSRRQDVRRTIQTCSSRDKSPQ
jgi:hypothetical protein